MKIQRKISLIHQTDFEPSEDISEVEVKENSKDPEEDFSHLYEAEQVFLKHISRILKEPFSTPDL